MLLHLQNSVTWVTYLINYNERTIHLENEEGIEIWLPVVLSRDHILFVGLVVTHFP